MKNNVTRSILLLLVFFFGCTGPTLLFFGLMLGYTFLYFGAEVIVIAAFIDAYYGYTNEVGVYYTLVTTFVVLGAQLLKPHLWVYNQ